MFSPPSPPSPQAHTDPSPNTGRPIKTPRLDVDNPAAAPIAAAVPNVAAAASESHMVPEVLNTSRAGWTENDNMAVTVLLKGLESKRVAAISPVAEGDAADEL